TKFSGKGKHTTFIVLRRPWLESHFPGLHIDLCPLEWQDFTRCSPAGDRRERGDTLHVSWQLGCDPPHLLRFKEPAAHIALLQQWNVWLAGDFPALHGERKHALERDEIAIDRCIGGALRLSLGDVAAQTRCRNRRQGLVSKCRP